MLYKHGATNSNKHWVEILACASLDFRNKAAHRKYTEDTREQIELLPGRELVILLDGFARNSVFLPCLFV